MIDTKKPHWVAAYTKSRNEKKALERLTEAGYEAYLPLQRTLKQWSDRKKWVEEPLLKSYIFIRITEYEYYNALKIPGLVRYIYFEGKVAPIPDNQIEVLKLFIEEKLEIETSDKPLNPGELVEINIGKLKGYEGEVVRHNGKKRVVIQLDHISHALLVTVPRDYLSKKKTSKPISRCSNV
ncbi:MAG: UpxY family transcription antiterminator [Tenuifilaceae bacterium]|nr:UpxY family transcription antiterminator [Tenuifilaceae bacterium]